MRIGHAGFALIAKRVRPQVSLLALLLAAYGPDIVEMLGRVVGVTDKAVSHSLVSLAVCATASALAYFAFRRNAADALTVWLAYVSHWPADFITGNKPTWPGGPIVGLGLYDRPVWDWTLEIALVIVALVIARPVLPVLSRRRPVS